ncbi:MAG: EAL domain-containing protein [Rhodoblastus sp.]
MADAIIVLPASERGGPVQDWMSKLSASARLVESVAECAVALRARRADLIVSPCGFVRELRAVRECADIAMLAFPEVRDAAGWSVLAQCAADEIVGLDADGPEFLARATRAIARRAPRVLEERRRTDRATGAQTRAGFLNDAPAREIEARREGGRLALVAITIANLDRVNAGYGRLVGDRLLRDFADRMAGLLDARSWMARLAGNSFAMLQITSDRAAFADEVRRIVQALEKPFEIAGESLALRIVARFACAPEDGATVEALLRTAQADLPASGAGGRVAHGDGARSPAIADEYLAQAIAAGDLALYYQPQVLLSGGKIAGVEALLRWRKPNQGATPPSLFLGDVTDANILAQLDGWIFAQAMFDLAAWRRQGVAPSRISINAGAAEIRAGSLLAAAQSCFAADPGVAGLFDIELPPEAFEPGADEHAGLAALRAIGMSLTLDVGHDLSSASGLPLEGMIARVKIDRFALRAPEARAFVAAMRERGMDVVATGVEAAQERAAARDIGCIEAQGHFFGHPASPTMLFKTSA